MTSQIANGIVGCVHKFFGSISCSNVEKICEATLVIPCDDGRIEPCASICRCLDGLGPKRYVVLVGKNAPIDDVAGESHSPGGAIAREDPLYRNERHIVGLGQLV